MRKLNLGLLALGLAIASAMFTVSARAAEPLTLRVGLYPYVPDRYAIFALLSREFQRRKENEGVTLELVEPDDEYYSGGLLKLDADVYEIDSILLSDMLPKIAPLTLSLSGFSRESVEAVTRNGVIYALPHWLCGNFLFYRKGDAEVRDAVTWDELIDVLKKRHGPIMADFFGHLTLGEWYFTVLADRVGNEAAQSAILANTRPDPQVISDLTKILSGCPEGFCRSKDLHNRTGYYARAFVRNQTIAYMGYSETLHYGLQEIIDDCRDDSGCLSANDIAVRRLPKLEKDGLSAGIGWVDGLAISNEAEGPKKAAALRFIDFATSEAAYKLVLTHESMEAPRYLLPARQGIEIKDAPLYADLLAAHAGRGTGTAPNLEKQLSAIAELLNCRLPIDRTDSKSQADCKLP